MFTIIITGGTGLVGTALTKMLLANGHRVIIFTREAKRSIVENLSYALWDIENQTIDTSAIMAADYIVHLAGAGVADKRWSEARKQEIVNSRTKSSALIVKALRENENNVKAVISASAIGWYGDDKLKKNAKDFFTESTPANSDFLGDTCRQWEESIKPVEQLEKRLVILRTGIVLSKDGGALAQFIRPVKFGVAGFLGGGKQVISWIHIEDLCRLYLYAIENEQLSDVYNAVATEPVTNKELTLELATRLRGRFFVSMHVPAFIIKTMLGGMSIEVLKSTKVSSQKIHAAGFQFLYPTIQAALPNLLSQENV